MRCKACLSFFVPELIWPKPGDPLLSKLDSPGLSWLLARGRLVRSAALPHEAALAALFGWCPPVPYGPLRLWGEAPSGPAPEGHWECADPVHLHFRSGRLIVAEASAFALSAEEAEALTTGLNRDFSEWGSFHAATPQRWYFRPKAPVSHEAPPALPLSAVAGRPLVDNFPRWLNEVQMLLHAHPVHTAREAAGLPGVNSVWPWGGGVLGAAPAAPPFECLWSDDPLAAGLARAAGLPVHPLPASLEPELYMQKPPAPLVTLGSLAPPVFRQEGEIWKNALEDLDRRWFAPAAAALGRGLNRIRLIAPTLYGHCAWEIAPARWRFWQKPLALATLAQQWAEE